MKINSKEEYDKITSRYEMMIDNFGDLTDSEIDEAYELSKELEDYENEVIFKEAEIRANKINNKEISYCCVCGEKLHELSCGFFKCKDGCNTHFSSFLDEKGKLNIIILK